MLKQHLIELDLLILVTEFSVPDAAQFYSVHAVKSPGRARSTGGRGGRRNSNEPTVFTVGECVTSEGLSPFEVDGKSCNTIKS